MVRTSALSRNHFRPEPPPVLPASGDLPATKTYRTRSWAFVPAADPSLPQLGTLTVCRGRKPTTYLVGFAGGELYFAKQDDAADVYAVRFASGHPAGCTCPGHRFAGHCVHRDAAAAMVTDGVIDPTPAAQERPF